MNLKWIVASLSLILRLNLTNWVLIVVVLPLCYADNKLISLPINTAHSDLVVPTDGSTYDNEICEHNGPNSTTITVHSHSLANSSEENSRFERKRQLNSADYNEYTSLQDDDLMDNLNASDLVLDKEQLEQLRNQIELLSNKAYRYERISYALAYGLIIVLSFFGNLLVCKVCLKNMTKTNALIMSLAASDLMMTVFNIPFNFFRLLNFSWPFGSVMCFLVNFVQHLVVYISSYTMAIIAIHRYRSVCGLRFKSNSKQTSKTSIERNECQLSPSKVASRVGNWCLSTSSATAQFFPCCGQRMCAPKNKQLYSMRAICTTIAITWILSALISALFTYSSTIVAKKDVFALIVNLYNSNLDASGSNTSHDINLNYDQESEHSVHVMQRCQNLVPKSVDDFFEQYSIKADFAKSVAVFVTQYFIPLAISCCLYIRIGKIITRQGKIATLRGNPKARIRQKKKRRRIVMLVLVVAVFAVCWLPIHAFHIFTDAGILNYNYQIFMMVHWLAMSSVSYNPFIYCWLNKHFRKAALRIFCCCCVEDEMNSVRRKNNQSRIIESRRGKFLNNVTCCARSSRNKCISNDLPPQTATSRLTPESALVQRSFLCAMQSNVSVATETSVVALTSLGSVEQLTDLESEQVLISPASKHKCKDSGLRFFHRNKSTRFDTTTHSFNVCQINIQDFSDEGAIGDLGEMELSLENNHHLDQNEGDLKKHCASIHSKEMNVNREREEQEDEDDDEAILNENEDNHSWNNSKAPFELLPITKTKTLFGKVDAFDVSDHFSEEYHLATADYASLHRINDHTRSRLGQENLILTTDL